MAIKASGHITLANVTDVASMVPYYKTQASTILTPPVFSGNTISTWSTTQPSLNTSNTCYIAFLTEFSDGTYDYSNVSTMSEYEAAKAAYNKAVSAETVANNTSSYFWYNTTDSGAGEGVGAHVTRIRQPDFVADPANGGGNVLITADDMQIRDGVTPLASFGETVTIGKTDNTHMVIAPSSLSSKKDHSTYFDVSVDGPYMVSERFHKEVVWIYDMFHTGTKTGTLDISEPTYENKVLLRFYKQVAKTGNHPSVLLSTNVITLGTAEEIIVYEDQTSSASVHYNYDGNNTLTVTYENLSSNEYYWVHAYLRESTRAPIYSFGLNSSGGGANSFGIGENTIHNGVNSFVLGKYNIPDDEKYAVIVGNGSTDAQSNALTIDWNGNVIGQAMAGVIQMYAGSVQQSVDSYGIITTTGAPDGWLLCDGSEVFVSVYPELAAVLGNTWGTPSSSNRVKLPDLRGRAPIGAGTGSGLTARTLGTKNIGAETVKLTAAQSGVPAHNHAASATASRYFLVSPDTESADSAAALSGSGYYFPRSKVTGWQHNANTQNNTAAGASSAHPNMQPSAVVNFIICTGRTYYDPDD